MFKLFFTFVILFVYTHLLQYKLQFIAIFNRLTIYLKRVTDGKTLYQILKLRVVILKANYVTNMN
jgi:hypothetical protein